MHREGSDGESPWGEEDREHGPWSLQTQLGL